MAVQNTDTQEADTGEKCSFFNNKFMNGGEMCEREGAGRGLCGVGSSVRAAAVWRECPATGGEVREAGVSYSLMSPSSAASGGERERLVTR